MCKCIIKELPTKQAIIENEKLSSMLAARDAPDPEILDLAGTGSKILVGSGSGRNRNRIHLTGSNKNVLKKISKWF